MIDLGPCLEPHWRLSLPICCGRCHFMLPINAFVRILDDGTLTVTSVMKFSNEEITCGCTKYPDLAAREPR